MNITYKPYDQAAEIIKASLSSALARRPVLWLLSGGSATKVYAQLAGNLDLELAPDQLVVGLVDERYDTGPHHASANDTAIRQTGLIDRLEQLGATYFPVLQGLTLQEETARYNRLIEGYIMQEQRRVVAVLGVGTDGHTAGILSQPDVAQFEQDFDANALVVGYENNGPFPERITLSLAALRLVDVAIVVVADPAKQDIVKKIADRANRKRFNRWPATIVQEMDNVIMFVPWKKTS